MESSAQEDMKISPTTVRRLRAVRGWSQEQLAVASGLSLRTIQRVESDGSASLETRTSLAATFGIQLAELGTEGKELVQPVDRSRRSIARYKISAGISAAAFLVAILGVAGFLPEGSLWLTSASTMLAIAMGVYSGFGWYFSSGAPNKSYFRRSVQAIFIYVALFCVFAIVRGNNSGPTLSIAAQIGALSMLIYFVVDLFFSRYRRSAGGA